MKRKLLLAISSLLPVAALAGQPEAMFVPEFAGGLDVNKIVSCENIYKEQCKLGHGGSLGKRLTQQSICTAKKMSGDKECRQASRLRQLSTLPPSKLRKYGNVSVLDVTSFKNGSEYLYMVDENGLFIALSTDLNFSKNKAFQKLKQKHKHLTLTAYPYMKRSGQNIFPDVYTLPNKNKRMVFKQELRNDYFSASSIVGVAEVAYEFNPKGVYMGAMVLKVEEV